MTKKPKTVEIPAVAIMRRSRPRAKEGSEQAQRDSHQRQWNAIKKLTPPESDAAYAIVNRFWESGSDWKKKRPEFDKMLAYCQARQAEGKPVHTILADELSRFSRRDSFAIHRDVDEFIAAGVKTIHVAESNRAYQISEMTREIGGYLEFVIAAHMAYQESRKTSRRVSEQRTNMAIAGRGFGGTRKYGLNRILDDDPNQQVPTTPNPPNPGDTSAG